MFIKWQNLRKNSKGFTLIELMIVVAIIAILAAIAIPQYTKYVKKTRTSAANAHASAIYDALCSWREDPDYGDGYFPTGVTTPTAVDSSKNFKDVFPSESVWCTTGDDYYTYSCFPSTSSVAKFNINALAKDSKKIFADMVKITWPGKIINRNISPDF